MGAYANIHFTNNFGASWQSIQTFGDETQKIQVINDSILMAIGVVPNCFGCWIRSFDNGASWLYSGTTGTDLHFFSDGTGRYSNGVQILYSNDFGQTFTLELAPPIDSALVSFEFANRNTGYAVGGKGAIYKYEALASTSENQISQEITVYPNPSTYATVIEIDSDMNQHKLDFKLFSSTGQLVFNNDFQSSIFTVPRNNLKSGLYFYRIIDDDGRIYSGKIIFE